MLPRDIIYSDRFQQELAEIEPNVKRTDEFLRGAEWLLARSPEAGNPISRNSSVWHLPRVDIPGLPPLAIYYTFSDRAVYMMSIRVSELVDEGEDE